MSPARYQLDGTYQTYHTDPDPPFDKIIYSQQRKKMGAQCAPILLYKHDSLVDVTIEFHESAVNFVKKNADPPVVAIVGKPDIHPDRLSLRRRDDMCEYTRIPLVNLQVVST